MKAEVIKSPLAAHSSGQDRRRNTTSLLERCKAGDRRAWQQLFAARAGQVYRWALFLGLGPSDAEDAAQEVFATLARRIESCQDERVLDRWLFQTTRRIVANQRRLSWFRRVLLIDRTSDDTLGLHHTTALTQDDELEIRQCLDQLSNKQRDVLVLMDVEGFTREETAEILGISAGTAASRLRLARQALGRAWADDDPTSKLSWRSS
jgi:RNA polymerase sigma factor (sigma-70 family)